MSAEDYEGAYDHKDPKHPEYAEALFDSADRKRKLTRGEGLAADEFEERLRQARAAGEEDRESRIP
jgi:hypothetical protein